MEKETITVSEEKPKEKNKRSGWWFLLILIPVIIAGIFVFKNQTLTKNTDSGNLKKTNIPAPEQPAVQEEKIHTDSSQAKIVEEQKTDTVKSSLPETKTEIRVEGPKFYLVGGGFKEQENAETYLQELKEKGLNPFHMGKRGNFYLVGIDTFKTEAEAIRARREYKENNPGSGAWVLEEK